MTYYYIVLVGLKINLLHLGCEPISMIGVSLQIIDRGRVDDLSFFDYSSPFRFLLIDFHSIFFDIL